MISADTSPSVKQILIFSPICKFFADFITSSPFLVILYPLESVLSGLNASSFVTAPSEIFF